MTGSGEERERDNERLRTLCDTLQAFTEASTEYPRLLRTVAERMVRVLADGCAVCLFGEKRESLGVVAVHHRDPAVAEAARVYSAAWIEADSGAVVSTVARTGQPLLIPTVDPAALARHFKPDVADFLSRVDVRSILFLPLQVSGLTLGTAVLSRHGPGSVAFDDDGVAVARTLADGAALAISNARLLDSLKRELDERKRAEEEASRYKALVQHSSDFVGMAGLDGEVLFVNEAGRKLLGIESADALSLTMFHTEDGMKRAPILQQHGRWEGQGELRHFKTGALIPTQVSSFLVRDGAGKPLGFATVQRDLREMRRLEDHMRQLQKMEAIGRLAAGVAHDFNNMLSVILSYGSLVIEALPASSEIRADVEEMVNAGQRASQLTQQLLAFSRQQVLELKTASINQIVSGMERMARRLLREDIQLRTELDPAIGSVKVDVGQMEQVILNLAVNARDAMPEGGTLTIATGNVTVAPGPPASDLSVPPGRYVTLRVSDTGSGMDEATLGKIFEPFFTTKAQGMGTGLGLATVFGVVKQCGGHIVVTSRVGKGTAFTVHLPVYEEEGRARASEASGASARKGLDGGRETILLVEDEGQVRKLMEGILRRAGYQVLNATSVNAALKVSAQFEERIHLLLTDVVMPKMSGPQLAARFGAARPEAKVLYVSGYMDIAVMDHGLEFLRKPFTPDGLLKRVREVLDGKTAPAGTQLDGGRGSASPSA